MRTYLYLSYKCNCNCFFCASDETNNVESKNEFSYADAKEFLLSSPNRKNLTISGGEPTIHKDFFKIIKFAKKHYESISLMTNGMKFSDMSFLKDTIDSGVDRLSIPFYSPNEEEHNWMVGNAHSFENVTKGLYNVNQLLTERSFYIQIKLLLAKFTYKQIPNSIDYITSNYPNIKNISLYGFHIGTKALNNKEYCIINYNESRPYNDLAINTLVKKNINFHICQIPLCAFSDTTLEVILRQNRIMYAEDSFIKRPDNKSRIESSPEFTTSECGICSMFELCPKIYGKNASSFEYGVRPFIIK